MISVVCSRHSLMYASSKLKESACIACFVNGALHSGGHVGKNSHCELNTIPLRTVAVADIYMM